MVDESMTIKMHETLIEKPKPFVTYVLIAMCLIVAGIEVYISSTTPEALQLVFDQYGFSAQGFMDGRIHSLVTSIFLHGSIDHLIFNVLALFFFGRAVEETMGWKKTLLIFFSAAIAGDLLTLVGANFGVIPMDIPTIGASAGIFGLMGTAMIVNPMSMVFYPFLIPIPLILVAILYTLYNIAAIIELFALGASTGVAYLAHMGGLSIGAIFGFREVGVKRGLIILIVMFLLILSIPYLLEYLQIFDYSGITMASWV
jgi:membrane associated rhomboid family serine protease